MPRPRKEFTVDVLGCCERHGRCTGEVCVTHLADHSPKSRNRPKGTMCIVTVKRCRLSRTQGTGSYWHRQGRRIRDQRLGVEEVRRQPKQRKSTLKGHHTGAQFLHRCIIYRPGDGGCGSEVV